MFNPTDIPLTNAKHGDYFQITKINIQGTMKRRLLDLGFYPSAIIEVKRKSPLGDPVAYLASQTTIALRKEESAQIFGKVVVQNDV